MNKGKVGCLVYGCLIPIGIVALLCVALLLLDWIIPSTARRSLPESATDIQEYSASCWNGDFQHLICARVPETDYHLYARKLGLQRYDPVAHRFVTQHIRLSVGEAPPWWNNVPEKLDNCYFKTGKDYILRIQWKDGWLYYLEVQT